MATRAENIIVIADMHIGCRYGLCCPPSVYKPKMDDGYYVYSDGQKKVWTMWRYFWDRWIPKVTKEEPFILVVNGDGLEGVHHNAKTPITTRHDEQINLAYNILAPIVDKSEKFFWIRGTEAHSGPSGEMENMLAERLGSVSDRNDNPSRWTMWLDFHGVYLHFCHTIPSTRVFSYEATVPMRELMQSYTNAGRWKNRPPDIIVRSHRHSCVEVAVPAAKADGNTFMARAIVTPCWSLKTPYAITYVPTTTPQVGGYLIRHGDEDYLFTRTKFWGVKQEEVVKV